MKDKTNQTYCVPQQLGSENKGAYTGGEKKTKTQEKTRASLSRVADRKSNLSRSGPLGSRTEASEMFATKALLQEEQHLESPD